MLGEKAIRSICGNPPTAKGLAGLAAMWLTMLLIGCGGEFEEAPADQLRATTLMRAKVTTHPYAVYFGGCSGTLVGPRALLSSRHCVPNLQVGQKVFIKRFDRTPDGEWDVVGNKATRVLRQKKGTDGLLLIELAENVGAYTSVCQEIFELKDRLTHYGAGATNSSGSKSDGKLRVSTDRIRSSGDNEYKIGPRHGSSGDSGGPYMYHNSVVGVHYGHRWEWNLFDGKDEWDVATNLADGWVFEQGISVGKRRCRPDLSLAWARGNVVGSIVIVEGSGNQIKFSKVVYSGRDDQHSTTGNAGAITLMGGATASGRVSASGGFCKAVGDGNAIKFHKKVTVSRGPNDYTECREAGSIYLQGAKLKGGVEFTGYISARRRKINFSKSNSDSYHNRLHFVP